MTLVKICGVRDTDTALLAAAAGADMIGLVFYPKSPRYVTIEQVRAVTKALRGARATTQAIGLTVNMPPKEIAALVREVGLDGVQLSGDETPEQVADAARAVRAIHPDATIFKSLRLTQNQSAHDALRLVAEYVDVNVAASLTILLDSFREGKYGGTGDVGDWTRAKAVAEKYPIILAGGLTPSNVADAIAQVQPYGVDVSSGVESAPGVKDLTRIEQFIIGAKSVNLQLVASSFELTA